ncbi:MAG: hypothetical protein M3033_03420 [Acidobacteriota bacterium]|nr:hypothetical protein [Acidobacteriota bacterium]
MTNPVFIEEPEAICFQKTAFPARLFKRIFGLNFRKNILEKFTEKIDD